MYELLVINKGYTLFGMDFSSTLESVYPLIYEIVTYFF